MFKPKLRFAPVTKRAPSRRRSLKATAVKAQLRSIVIADMPAGSTTARSSFSTPADRTTVACQNVPMLENIQYQNQMISAVPPQAAT